MSEKTMTSALFSNTAMRSDHRLVSEMVTDGARVLDVGCGDGVLLHHLARNRGVDARGIEISREGVAACVSKGLAVIQGDADTDLSIIPMIALTLSSCRRRFRRRASRVW